MYTGLLLVLAHFTRMRLFLVTKYFIIFIIVAKTKQAGYFDNYIQSNNSIKIIYNLIIQLISIFRSIENTVHKLIKLRMFSL